MFQGIKATKNGYYRLVEVVANSRCRESRGWLRFSIDWHRIDDAIANSGRASRAVSEFSTSRLPDAFHGRDMDVRSERIARAACIETTTRRRAVARTSAALRPAAPPPTIPTS